MDKPLPPGSDQDAVLMHATQQLQDKGFLVAQFDKLAGWAQTGSFWPMTFGLACCAVEMMHTACSRYDLDGFGRLNCRQTDCLGYHRLLTRNRQAPTFPKLALIVKTDSRIEQFITSWICSIIGIADHRRCFHFTELRGNGEVPMSTSTNTLVGAVFTAFLFATSPALAEVEVLWLGHATTRITSEAGKVIVIDPFLKKNPKSPAEYKDLKALGKVDLILVTHGHFDHVQDLEELASLSSAPVVANYDYALQLVALGVIDGGKAIAMNKGGTVEPLGRGIKVHMVPADHSSSVDSADFERLGAIYGPLRFLAGGTAVGYVVELENGFKIYHSGDTNVFGDMALINKFHAPDLALVCIGGFFTMDPEGAAYAVRELIKPKQVLPIHYGTYPVINRTPAEFKEALGETEIQVLVPRPGEALKF